MKTKILFAFTLVLITFKSEHLIADAYIDKNKFIFSGIVINLDGENYKIVKKKYTPITEGHFINEFFIINADKKNKLKSAFIIRVGSMFILQYHLRYINHRKVCDYEKAIFLKNKFKGNFFNCLSVNVDYPYTTRNPLSYALDNNYGNTNTFFSQEIKKYLNDRRIVYNLGAVSSHKFFSFKKYKRHIFVDHFISHDYLNNKITDNILKKAFNRKYLDKNDHFFFEQYLNYFKNYQLIFEKSIGINKRQSLYNN